MQLDILLNNMNDEVYQRLCQASETGKWPNGEKLSEQQREQCLQAVMLYQAKVLKTNEHMSVSEQGEIVHKSKAQLRRELEQQSGKDPIATFGADDI